MNSMPDCNRLSANIWCSLASTSGSTPHNAYDFSILGNTPIFFPIEWHNSKIPGFAGRVSVPNLHGFSALMIFSSVAARFFPPQIGGLGVTVGQSGLPFRIDHDEKFNQTTHLQ